MIAMIGTSDRLCWLAETCKILCHMCGMCHTYLLDMVASSVSNHVYHHVIIHVYHRIINCVYQHVINATFQQRPATTCAVSQLRQLQQWHENRCTSALAGAETPKSFAKTVH